MSTLTRERLATAALTALLAAAVAGCGDVAEHRAATPRATTATAAAHAEAADGDWLLRFGTAEGADGEQTRTVLVRYNPTTGAASARALPVQNAPDASQDEQSLLVSADHAWAVPDTAVPQEEARSGKLVVYSARSDATRTLDLEAMTGERHVTAEGWAFDPTTAGVLRIVDADRNVWKVDVADRRATKERRLPARDGWIFGDGFAKDSGEPYIESIDSDDTEPAGNGDSNTRPVQRQGGTLLPYDGQPVEGLPAPPCDLATAFRYDDGSAWLFCAEAGSVTAYQGATGGTSWHPFGKPSPKVVPDDATELTFALPPVG